MVPHQDAVPSPHEPKAGEPGDEEQEEEAGRCQHGPPGNGDEPAGPGRGGRQDPPGRPLGVTPQLCSQGGVHFGRPAWLAVIHQGEGHAVEVVESVVERVVAVVPAGGTVHALVPFSWRQKQKKLSAKHLRPMSDTERPVRSTWSFR